MKIKRSSIRMEPELRKIHDPFNFYNIAAVAEATAFCDIIDPKGEEFGCKSYPYLGKFDRSLRAH